MRLFVAIKPSVEVKNEIRRELENFREKFSTVRGLRLVPEGNWHITLLFLGERSESNLLYIEEAIREAVRGLKTPLRIVMSSISWGPNERNPRTIWADTDQASSRVLGDFKRAIAANLEKRGIVAGDEKLFNGHVTLARLKDRSRAHLPKIAASLQSSFVARSVFLESSTLTPEGSIYITLAEVGG